MKNKIGIVFRFLLCTVLAAGLALGVSAQSETGSLTLVCHVSVEGSTRPLAGDVYALVPVADATVKEGPKIAYATRPEFAAFDCDWGGQTASQLHAAATAMKDTALHLAQNCPTGITDADGQLTWKNLAPGLYMVVRVQAAPENETTLADPFLVSVPLLEDGVLYSTVTTTPKFAVEEETGTPPEPTPLQPAATPEPVIPQGMDVPAASRLPQTGQLDWPIPILLVAGAGLLMLGLALRHKQENSDHEA